jgi:1,4-dihydroxy-2-naphthoate octaprenyltransferase
VIAAVTLYSVYGQLYNQIRDLDMDKAAGLKNTSIILGEQYTRYAIWLTVGLGVVCMIVAVLQSAFPLWLGGVGIIAILVSLMFRPQADMRGSDEDMASATMQIRALIVFNIIMLAWLAVVLFTQITG